MYRKFENISATVYNATLVALVYSILLLIIGVLPGFLELGVVPYAYIFLLAACLIACGYALVLFFIWVGHLAYIAHFYGFVPKKITFITIISFFIPFYNLFAPALFFNFFMKSLKIKGYRELIVSLAGSFLGYRGFLFHNFIFIFFPLQFICF